MEAKSINLFKTEGSSDKVYNVELKPVGGAWAVQAYNGRRGKPLKLQDKGQGLAYDIAADIYAKLVKSKIKGGYTEHEDGVSFSSSAFAGEKTDFRAQLLNEISLDDALALGDEWLVQEKHDGERRGLYEDESGPVYANRDGIATGVQGTIDEAFRQFCTQAAGGILLDAEDMGAYVEIFDVIKHPALRENASFGDRAECLSELEALALGAGVSATLRFNVPVPATEFFATRLTELQERGGEGFVLRHRDAAYTPGRPNSGGLALKVKFWKDVTCRVSKAREGKRSVGLELLDDRGAWTPVGNVTIPANADIPALGSLIDVKYLYAYPGGSIFQPSYLRPRNDIPDEDCRIDRLHFKGEAAPLSGTDETLTL